LIKGKFKENLPTTEHHKKLKIGSVVWNYGDFDEQIIPYRDYLRHKDYEYLIEIHATKLDILKVTIIEKYDSWNIKQKFLKIHKFLIFIARILGIGAAFLTIYYILKQLGWLK